MQSLMTCYDTSTVRTFDTSNNLVYAGGAGRGAIHDYTLN